MAAKWTRKTEVLWEELDGGALLVDSKTGARWTLNRTAAALWRWCDGSASLNQLAARLAHHSRRSVREARAEVRSFCENFAALNLLAAGAGKGAAIDGSTVHFSGLNIPASFNALGLGHGPRVRPGPRGVSIPG